MSARRSTAAAASARASGEENNGGMSPPRHPQVKPAAMAAPGAEEGPALLLYSATSANSHKATIALEELQLPYTLRKARAAQQQRC